MSASEHLLQSPAAQAIGWALVHFVWQGALIGTLTAATLVALRRSAADVRYVVSTIALSLMLTLPTVTAVQFWRSAVDADSGQRHAAPAASSTNPGTPGAADLSLSRSPVSSAGASVDPSASIGGLTLERWLPTLVLTWLSGVVVLSLRLMSGWWWVQRMKSHGTSATGASWEELAARLSRRLHIARRVRLLQSSLVDVPTVIGWIKPIILLPASALSGLTPRQLEAILAHELAHIRRHDYLVNLLQTLVETMLFYHPAVWWLSRRIRAERENCCDDLAISLSGDPYTYATALADLEELRGPHPQLALAASGASLAARIRRVLGAPAHAGRAPGWLAAAASVLVMFGIAAGAVSTDALRDPATTSPTAVPDVVATHAGAVPSPPASGNPRKNAAPARHSPRTDARLDRALERVTGMQAQTHAATAPPRAQAHVAASASSLDEAALLLAAEADARWSAIVEVDQQLRMGPRLAHADRLLPQAAAPRFSTLPVFAAALAEVPAGRGAQSHRTMTWRRNGERMEIRFDGEFEFSDDDTDVQRLSPGGSLQIKEGGFFAGFFASHTVEFTADRAGNITRRFWSGMTERPFDPEGRQWLARYLPTLIRQTGFGARTRVARILKSKGTAGVLAEISLIEGSWGKKTYFTELLKAGPLDAAAVRQILAQAGREIDSDFELATLLIESADRLLVDDGTRTAYFEATRSIESDFEMARVCKHALTRGAVGSPLLEALLDTSRHIDSDFELATLLVQVAKLQALDTATRPPFFTALETVGSDFEHGRVLKALAERPDLTPDTAAAMVISADRVGSDFEKASFLLELAKRYPIEGAVREPFFRSAGSIGSSFERGRVLQTVIRRTDASPDTVLAVLRATGSMDGNFEASQVLLAVAAAHPVAGPARDAYIDAAGKLGDYEQGRVLAALVRSERRK